MPRTKPRALRQAGSDLWTWLAKHYDVSGCEPLAMELCQTADRLTEVRSAMAAASNPADLCRLINAETKLGGQYARLWRVLGLADMPDQPKRPVGRPPAYLREIGQ